MLSLVQMLNIYIQYLLCVNAYVCSMFCGMWISYVCVLSMKAPCVWVYVLCVCVHYVYALCVVCWVRTNAYLEALECRQQHVEKQCSLLDRREMLTPLEEY